MNKKEKLYDYFSRQRKKEFNKIQHSFLKKTLNKLGMEINFLNMIKGICEKSTGNIILIGKRLMTLALRCEWSLFSSLLFILVLRVRASAIRQK